MQAEIRLPELGTRPVVLSVWFADAGETVFEGDRLVEVLVAGATFDVAAPGTGRLVEKRSLPNDILQPGQVLGIVEVEEATTDQ
jgi:pyruvate/2-oxoglutarate dehydrogenase complex dihydrolipoamide acyltransferase (E2) component